MHAVRRNARTYLHLVLAISGYRGDYVMNTNLLTLYGYYFPKEQPFTLRKYSLRHGETICILAKSKATSVTNTAFIFPLLGLLLKMQLWDLRLSDLIENYVTR